MLTAHLVSPNTARRSLDFAACYAQVLDSLQKCLQSILDHYLPLCEQDINCKEYGWQNLAPLQQKNNGNTFIAIQQKHGLMLLWLDAMLPQTSPWALSMICCLTPAFIDKYLPKANTFTQNGLFHYSLISYSARKDVGFLEETIQYALYHWYR